MYGKLIRLPSGLNSALIQPTAHPHCSHPVGDLGIYREGPELPHGRGIARFSIFVLSVVKTTDGYCSVPVSASHLNHTDQPRMESKIRRAASSPSINTQTITIKRGTLGHRCRNAQDDKECL